MTPLRDLTYYQTGGRCTKLEAPTTISELQDVMKNLWEQKTPYFFLGAGSNSLVMDEFYDGTVVSFHRLNQLNISGNEVYAEAGVINSDLVKACADHSLQGASWMYRLPGQLGATTRMNARCYGGEISEIVKKVLSVTPDGKLMERDNQGLFHGYKDTCFMTNGEAIAAVIIELSPGDQDQIRQKMTHCETDRTKKNQFLHPSCGCVFKNHHDVGVPSGMLLEAAGAKKLSTPQVEINPHHANFVFNKGATSRSILETTLQMRQLVYDAYGVFMEYEMEILGNPPDDLKEALSEMKGHNLHLEKLQPLQEQFQKRVAPKG